MPFSCNAHNSTLQSMYIAWAVDDENKKKHFYTSTLYSNRKGKKKNRKSHHQLKPSMPSFPTVLFPIQPPCPIYLHKSRLTWDGKISWLYWSSLRNSIICWKHLPCMILLSSLHYCSMRLWDFIEILWYLWHYKTSI